ncbi:MAG: glutamine synthetase [Lachnospiraceae bacterium]|nr:glutamine synthetase [Lachnospiraceae bacterium]
MGYTPEEVIKKVQEENVRFICLSFTDILGNRKSVTILPEQLPRAFRTGIPLDASQIEGFRPDSAKIDLLIRPDPDSLSEMSYSLMKPDEGHILHMYADIYYPDGCPFENDPRLILKSAVETAESGGYSIYFGPAMEFYLMKDGVGEMSPRVPYDNAGYMESWPTDKCELIRREICYGLKSMEIQPECAYHEAGPGQNKIKFRFADAVRAADAVISYRSIVQAIADEHGLYAEFSPKPLEKGPGNSMHINMSIRSEDGVDRTPHIIAGILSKLPEITAFLNPTKKSYKRLGHDHSPKYISWSEANRSTAIRIPAYGKYTRFELRTPDNGTNPYIAFALLIYACLYGINEKPELQKASNEDLFTADSKTLSRLKALPMSLTDAQNKAKESGFVKAHLPKRLIDTYTKDR